MTLTAGAVAGVIGALVTLLIHGLEQIAGFSHLFAVVIPTAAGVFAGACWWRLRTTGGVPSVNKALASTEDSYIRLPFLRSVADGFLQILVVGAGASLGREAAPRQIAAAATDQILAQVRIPATLKEVDASTRIAIRGRIIAAATGAGLAAVYNVPVAGIIYTMELLPVKRDKYTLIVSTVMSVVATLVSRPIVGGEAFYQLPTPSFNVPTFTGLLLAAVLATITGVIFRRVIMIRPRLSPRLLPLTIGTAMLVMGLVSLWQPTLLGNGEMMLNVAFGGAGTTMVILLVAKVLLTWMCLSSGAAGGVLTPSLAVGGAAGAVVALGMSASGFAASVPLLALAGAGCVLAIMQRAPFFALVFALELTHPPVWAYLPVAAVALAGYYATRRLR